jgi:hypothetical protein
MESLGRTLLLVGIALALLGAWLAYGPGIPWLGKLPGDIRIERPGTRIYIPITTSILLSVVLSLMLYLVARLR